MKNKIISLIVSICLAVSLCACGNFSINTNQTPNEETSVTDNDKNTFEISYTSCDLCYNVFNEPWLKAIAEVTNIGTSVLEFDSAEFDIWGADIENIETNEVTNVDSIPALPHIISPGEKAYFCYEVPFDNIDADEILILEPKINAEEAEFKRIDLPVSGLTLEDDYFVTINGQVENNTNIEIETIFVFAVLYNLDNEPITVLSTLLFDDLDVVKLSPNDKSNFELRTTLDIPLDSISDYKVTAFVTEPITTEIIQTETQENSSESQEEVTNTSESQEENNVPWEYISALESAEFYGDNLHMSKAAIYDQLTSEYGGKFTAEAAQYAIDNIVVDWNENALISAENYSEDLHMSKASIYDQLISEYGEKFTEEEAQYAIDNIVADWKENALEKAKSYKESMSMSPAAIYDQLTSEYGEQFTAEEAQYAIDNLE